MTAITMTAIMTTAATATPAMAPVPNFFLLPPFFFFFVFEPVPEPPSSEKIESVLVAVGEDSVVVEVVSGSQVGEGSMVTMT